MDEREEPAASRSPTPAAAPTGGQAVAQARLAVTAAHRGDDRAAGHHIAGAQRQARTIARRHRQVVEIAALIVARQGERAAGLACIHGAEFPDDAGLLETMLDPPYRFRIPSHVRLGPGQGGET